MAEVQKRSRRDTIATVVVVLLLVGLPVAWLIVKSREFKKLSPQGGTLTEHLATMPEPVDYRIITVAGEEHLAVHGPLPSRWSFPSGGPVYIFDRSGRLVDHTTDAGDAGAFHEKWPGVYHGQQVTREEAVRWVAAKP